MRYLLDTNILAQTNARAVVTDNGEDFEGVKIVVPLRGSCAS
jgi:hypothetical protein